MSTQREKKKHLTFCGAVAGATTTAAGITINYLLNNNEVNDEKKRKTENKK